MGFLFITAQQTEKLIVPDSIQKAKFAETVEKIANMDLEKVLTNLVSESIWVGLKIVLALAIYMAGRWLIGRLIKLLSTAFEKRKVDRSLQIFLRNLIKTISYIVLILLIIQVMGINTTSIVALLASVAVAVCHPEINKLKWSMLSLDALALGLYAVNGTSKAMMYHTSGMTAVFLGMFTALGGGLIRDMLINEVPMVIRDKHWYAVPSAVGCVLTVLVCKGVDAGIVSFPAEVVLDLLIVALMVSMRLVSVIFDIQLPGALVRHNTYLPSEAKYLKRPVIHSDKDSDKRKCDKRR